MSTVTNTSSTSPGFTPGAARIPPLQSGDRLSRDEFERRYRAMPKGVKCELVEGVVYVTPPPVSDDGHSSPQFWFVGWLAFYAAMTPGTQGGDNGTVRLDGKNEPQPDIFLRISPAYGGQSRTSEDDYVEGAPELITEISASSASYDLHDKLEAYRRNGVQEYIVWRTLDGVIDWFKLEDGKFVLQHPNEQGIIRSSIFPGLWLDVLAMLAGQRAKVLQVLQQGIASPEHREFVARLEKQSG